MSTFATTKLPDSQNVGLFHKCQLFNRSTCSTERQGNKRSAAADLIASIAPMRIRRTCVRLPSKPPYKKPESKGRLWSPLACLSSISFFTQRKISPPEAPAAGCRIRAGKNVKQKDMVPKGRIVKNAAGKNVKPKKPSSKSPSPFDNNFWKFPSTHVIISCTAHCARKIRFSEEST